MIGNNKMNTKIHFIFFVFLQLSCFAQSSAIVKNTVLIASESIATFQRNSNGPTAPTAIAQALCQGSTVSNLVASVRHYNGIMCLLEVLF